MTISAIDWETLYAAELDFRFLRAKARSGLDVPVPSDGHDLDESRANLVRVRTAFLRKART